MDKMSLAVCSGGFFGIVWWFFSKQSPFITGTFRGPLCRELRGFNKPTSFFLICGRDQNGWKSSPKFGVKLKKNGVATTLCGGARVPEIYYANRTPTHRQGPANAWRFCAVGTSMTSKAVAFRVNHSNRIHGTNGIFTCIYHQKIIQMSMYWYIYIYNTWMLWDWCQQFHCMHWLSCRHSLFCGHLSRKSWHWSKQRPIWNMSQSETSEVASLTYHHTILLKINICSLKYVSNDLLSPLPLLGGCGRVTWA